ncbi:unnamed protein product [Rotaria socialis]|uniref:Argonaute linker 1 domain-containing protein n=1 Tax=Rotaria socialis TaxID=392032 RepID=A0A819WUM8_9BILA|nr:unnamed protein product [Rotaria socialis]CAF3298050.1 unnamed protein product [Rotaria socialis]CAF4126915.1 unnamed protein product [Rotaria socialis]CAF4442209.1 unnamed protein product [Rotaria socialis]
MMTHKNGHKSRIDGISSDYSQRRSYSSRGIVDKKSFHDEQKNIDSHDVASISASNAEIYIEKCSRLFVHPTGPSSILNPKITTIAKRPSETGNAGQRIEIYVNHFKINFCTPPNKVIVYQFDVDVEILMSDSSWYSCGKDERIQVMKQIINKENFPLVWYDEGKNLYSIENLMLNLRKKEYQCEINDKNTGQTNRFRFLILNLVKIYTLKTIFDFIQNKISIKPHGLVKILESLFKQTQRSDIITIKNQSYRKHQGGAIGLASGFYQSIVLCERGLTLNINKSFVSFYQNYNLVQFLSCYMGHDIQKNGISSKDQALLVEKILKFLWFIMLYQEDDCQYRLKSFGRPANQHKYIINGDEPLTAVNYFNDR